MRARLASSNAASADKALFSAADADAAAAVSAAADHSGRPFAAVLPPALAAFLGVVDAAAAERRAHAAVLRRKSSVRERKSMQDAEDRDGIARRETFQSTKL